MIFRRIQESDISSCAKLFTQVFSSSPWNENWSEEKAFERLLHFYQSKGFVGIIAEKGDIKGFALGNLEPFYSGPIFYLREMCTATAIQNNGIGKQTLTTLEAELTKINVRSIYLATDSSISAASFYTNYGFSLTKNFGFYEKSVNS